MRKKILSYLLTIVIVLISTTSFAQEIQLPENFQEQMFEEYNAMPAPEISFNQFYNTRADDYIRVATIHANPILIYNPGVVVAPTPCGNGDFESGLSTTEWQGGYGSINSAGVIQYGTFTNGILGGAINLNTSHQTLVSTGIDPNAPISMVAPGGSTKAVRIGNAVNGNGAELLAKTFTVTAANSVIAFWYALVLEDPSHQPYEQPAFTVRILNSSNVDITTSAMVNLGNGSNKAVADHNNPFFKTLNNGSLVYRDWTCAQLNLSSLVGQQITIQFVTNDRTQGGHYGYAYLDNFCGTCSTANYHFSLNIGNTSKCGKGSIAYNYTLPTQGSLTGTVQIKLHLLQNGTGPVITSPVLTSGTGYAFSIDPIALGMNPAFGGFDYYAEAIFAIGSTSLGTYYDGNTSYGQITGINNDYQVYCPTSSTCSDTCYWKLTGNNILNGNNILGTLSNHDVRLFTNSVMRGIITAGGNFGMGTSAPVSELQVHTPNGDNHLVVSGNAPSVKFQLPATALPNAPATFGVPYAKIGLSTGPNNFVGGSTAGDLIIQNIDDKKSIIFSSRFASGNGVEHMRLNAAGRLGIGTANPNNRVEITHGTVNNSGLRFTNLTSLSPAVINPGTGKVLSVNSAGDVILVQEQTGGIYTANQGITLSGNVFQLGDDCGRGGSAFFSNREINMKNNNLYFNSSETGKLYMGLRSCPQLTTRLEISSLGLPAVNGYSPSPSTTGLRFSDINANTAPVQNQYKGVLSLDTDGDVIWVEDKTGGAGSVDANNGLQMNGSYVQLGRKCEDDGDVSADLSDNRAVPLNHHNLIFKDGVGDYKNLYNRVGIGNFPQSCDLLAKLHVEKQYTGVDPFSSIGILSHNEDPSEKGDEAIAIRGVTDANNSKLNIGVQGIATGKEYVIGGSFSACGGNVNIGVYGAACDAQTGGAGPSYAGYFNGDVFSATGVFTGSDQRIKKNVQPISNAMELISRIEPKKYQLDNKAFPSLNLSGKENYGVIAQDLEKILPSLVKEVPVPQDKGFTAEKIKSVNYTELIPILIQGMKDQQTQIEAQQAQIKAQQAQIDQLIVAIKGGANDAANQNAVKAIAKINVELSDKNVIVLGQNVPNPFDNFTTIGFNIPKEVKAATINFTSLEGKSLRSVTINERGKGVINVYANELSAGIYLYTLIADGKVVATKKMEIMR